MRKVQVAGSTGFLSRFVVQEFNKRGYWIRAPARNPQKFEVASYGILAGMCNLGLSLITGTRPGQLPWRLKQSLLGNNECLSKKENNDTLL